MKRILLVLFFVMGAANLFAIDKPTPAAPFYDEAEAGLINSGSTNPEKSDKSDVTMSVTDVLLDGGNRLVDLQNDDGGWDWPLDDGNSGNSSPKNTVGPIAMGLAHAYTYTMNTNQKATLSNAGAFLLAKTNNFSPSDGYLSYMLDLIFGGSIYKDHVINNFYTPLANGTYNKNGAGTLYNTNNYVNSIRTTRANQGIANLAAWDIGMGLVGAASCGADVTAWIAGVKAEINELDGAGYYDVIGLAGALYGLAFVGEEYDPTAGQHASASNLADLANILASYQINNGGFSWNMNYIIANDGNETIQETAYSVLALNELNRSLYYNNILGAAQYMQSVQLATGGWENYVGSTPDENNEITGEALWAINVVYNDVVWVDDDYTSASCGGHIWGYNAFDNIQDGVDAVADGGTVNVMGGTYVEQVTVGKTLNLIGNGSSKPAIDGNNSGLPILILTGDNITITGFTIRNSGLSSPACGIAMVQNSGCQIYNNNLFNNFIGIALAGSDENIIESNNITSNAACGVWINNDEDAAALGFTGCSYLNGSDNNIVRNNEITNNSGEGGIYIAEYCANNIVEFNNISDNNGNGIYLWKSDATIIRNNSCVGSNSTGIHIMASKDNEVYNNYFSSGNSLPAIHLRDGHRRNASGVWQDWTSSGNIINDNHFHANCPLLVKSESETVLDATCNWWGTTNGCTFMPKILGPVDFIPFLNSGEDSDHSVTNGFQPAGDCDQEPGIVTNLNTGKWFCSIQSAIDDTDTHNGHILQAGDGIYNENITVTKELTIQAGSTPVINGQIIVSADNVTLQGLTIQNSPVVNNRVSSGILIEASNVLVKDNIIKDISGDNGISLKGIQVWQDDSHSISNIRIINNKIHDLTNTAKGAYGILVQGNVSDVLISNNIISNITSEGWALGIEVSYSGNVSAYPSNVSVLHNLFESINPASYTTASYPGAAFQIDVQSSSANVGTVKVNYNKFVDMPIGISNRDNNYILDGRYNWWGSCDGPSGFGPGNGAAVTDFVDFEPWIGQDAVLWLSPTLLLGHSGNVSDWNDASCNGNDASMDQTSRQPMYGSMIFNDGPAVAFANDYSNTGYANSDIMTVNYSSAVTSGNDNQWEPEENPKSLFVAFQTGNSVDVDDDGAYYNDGRQCIFEAGGPLSGYNVYIYNGKLVFGMWNRFQQKYTILEESSFYPLSSTKSYYAYLAYENDEFTATISDGETTETSNPVPFSGITMDGSDLTGIGGAARTCFHDYNTGETYSNQFNGKLGDVIVFNPPASEEGTPVVGGGDEEFDPQEIIDYLSARYFPEQGEVPGKIGSGWKVIENNRIEGFESVSAAYPNPFDATSSFSVNLPIEQNVIIELYDAMGNKVTDIFSGNLSKGIHDFTIDGVDLTNGVYIFRVVGENFKADGKVVLNK